MHTRHCLAVFLAAVFAVLPAVAQPAALHVASVAPLPNAVGAARDGGIDVVFNAPVDPATVTDASVTVFGQWSGVMDGTLRFEDGNTRVRFVPARSFSAGERVTVSLARTVASADGAALETGYAWQYWTRAAAATLDLTETARLPVRQPGEEWIQTYGAYAGDLDGDGYTDFFVPNERPNDVRVFMNDGAGGYDGFTVYPIAEGARPSTNEGADFDKDGALDVAVGNSANAQVSVFMNDGTGGLETPVSYEADTGVRGLAVLDLDADGYMDLATANRDAGTVALLRNDGDGTFTRTSVIDPGGSGETAAAAADANHDGILDLFVGTWTSEEILLLLGDGRGGLVPHSRTSAGGASWMIVTGDVNGDGHVDVVSANSSDNNASVVFGDGAGNLSPPVTYPTGAFPLAIDLGDLDGDGDLDLVASSFRSSIWTIYENDGTGAFTFRRSLSAAQAASCAVLHDRDNDGALDLTGIDEVEDLLFLFTNTPAATATETPPPSTAVTLLPGYPNPFSTRTTLTFRLDVPSRVRLALYDVRGRVIRTLMDEPRPPGEHRVTWDGTDQAGRPVPAGLYVYRLQAGTATRSQPIVHVKPVRDRLVRSSGAGPPPRLAYRLTY